MTRNQHIASLELQRAALVGEVALQKARWERSDGAMRVQCRAQIEALMRRDCRLRHRLAELSQEPGGARAALRTTWRNSVHRLHEAIAHWIDHADVCNL